MRSSILGVLRCNCNNLLSSQAKKQNNLQRLFSSTLIKDHPYGAHKSHKKPVQTIPGLHYVRVLQSRTFLNKKIREEKYSHIYHISKVLLLAAGVCRA
jgi:hypothetical protein